MPSKAFTTFLKNLKQVDKLLETYDVMLIPTKGKKSLDHFTRAALIFLCSSWEVYIEQVAKNAGEILSNKCRTPNDLPTTVQKTIASIVKTSKHNLSPIEFASDWKNFYKQQINIYTSKLNTPKKDKVTELLNKYIGISGERIHNDVPCLSEINKIVSDRGSIAHNVYAQEYLKKEIVSNYYQTINILVKQIECLLWNYLAEATDGNRPWQMTDKCKLDNIVAK